MRPKILFVDDEPHNTKAIIRALRKEPFDILTAESGMEGLDVLANESVDIIVSDERMPGMSGSEFLARACRQYPETIRIILTGHADVNAAIRAINEGEVYRFLTKPFNPTELIVTIRQAFQHKQLIEQSRRLLRKVKHQSAILDELETRNPGITSVEKDECGSIIVDEADYDMDRLLEEINAEVTKSESTMKST